jgi:hypothetical protein
MKSFLYLYLVLLGVIFALSSCSTPVAPISTDPEQNFESLWKEFAQTSPRELYTIMSALLENLKDGHVSLATEFGTYSYTGWYSRYPANFLGSSVISRYLSKDYGTLAGGMLRYGKISENIGYIYIGPNLIGDNTVWSQAIDQILDSLWTTRGIILDIRNNGGGNDALGNIIISRFADTKRLYSFVQFRNGSSHADFTPLTPAYIVPLGKRQFTKPIMLLTNRRCISSAEGTILMARVLPHVTTIGDTTAGGSANPIELQLPNGWKYRISRWIQYTADQTVFEGIGLPPQIVVSISAADATIGKDRVLENAIERIR